MREGARQGEGGLGAESRDDVPLEKGAHLESPDGTEASVFLHSSIALALVFPIGSANYSTRECLPDLALLLLRPTVHVKRCLGGKQLGGG